MISVSANTTEVPSPVKDNRTKKGIAALLCAVIAFSAGTLTEYLLNTFTDIDPEIPTRLCRAVLSMAAFVILGGKKWMHFDLKAFGKTFLICLPIFIYTLYLTVPEVIWQINNPDIPPGMFGRICYFLGVFIVVGLNEEFIFRGLVLGGLLLWLGKKKNGILIASIIASLIFGYFHVMNSIDFTNIYSVLTSLFKTLQTGMFGIFMCYCFIKFKQVLGIAAVHFLDDFLLHLPNTMERIDTGKEYVHVERDAAISSIIWYSECMLVYLIPVIIMFIKMRKMKPMEEPFGDDEN